MAIADRTTTAAALARQFADLLADEPAVERIWYLEEPPRAPWSRMYLTIYVQASEVTDEFAHRAGLAVRSIAEARQDVEIPLSLFSLDALPNRDIEEEVEPTAVELALTGR